MLQREPIRDAVYLPIKMEAELEALLQSGNFDTMPFEEPLVSEELRWQLYFCHRRGALVTVSFALLLDGSQSPFITISTCRKLLWFWILWRDRRMVRDIIDFLLKNGASRDFNPTT